GLYTEREETLIQARLAAEEQARHLAETTSIRPEQADPLLAAAGGTPLAHAVRIAELVKRQGVTLTELLAAAGIGRELGGEALVTAELELKYAGYFERER